MVVLTSTGQDGNPKGEKDKLNVESILKYFGNPH